MKKLLSLSALGMASLLLAGCSANGAGGDLSTNLRNALPNTARSILAARAYDRGKLAAQRQDQRGADAAFRDYMQFQREQSSLTRLAEWFVAQGAQYDTDAMQETEGSAAKKDLLGKSDESYQRALTFSNGSFASDDPSLLNALGYFLADRGTSPADFREAERLTRLSLANYAKREQENPNNLSPAMLTNVNAATRANVRDSLAWALYRQGKYAAAEREQVAALGAWQTAMTALGNPDRDTQADLTYHLAMIYAAQNKTDLARAAFQKALQLRPVYPAATRGLLSLEPSTKA